MLIKLTSKCLMMCPHCMEDAQETGLMMTLDTFKQAVKFGTYIGNSHFVLSGGEPTENEHITEMCEWMQLATGCNFSIVSNGMWLKDERKRQRIEWISRLSCYLGMQVYTNKQWYKEYDYVISHKHEYEKYNKVIVDADSHIFMQDLGRAKTSPEAQKEVEQNPHFMSCLNATLVAIQKADPQEFGIMMMLHRQFCKPSVDARATSTCQKAVCARQLAMSIPTTLPTSGNVCVHSAHAVIAGSIGSSWKARDLTLQQREP